MKILNYRTAVAAALAMFCAFAVSCGSPQAGKGHNGGEEAVLKDREQADDSKNPFRKKKDSGSAQDFAENFDSFAQAHDAFTTNLARKEKDNNPIPAPPDGLFDLIHYPSKVGDLAAYISCDPEDGQKHPLIIWVVGGWGNGIDDFPWVYPEWEDDQTGSAFWQAGLLAMYPSFRGGSGNPGYYEALFGEVDDILSAYEYAASLPYVDPDRIYLGGHSTGGTRALLASEYTDKFRAVFCFGAVDEIKYHNNTQFTFDTGREEEYIMRSPIHWLSNVKSPTYLIEGSEGNSQNLKRILEASQNDSIHGFIIPDADHFSVLAPVTRLLAQKTLADTGTRPNISVTQEELEEAMAQAPAIPNPVMSSRSIEELGLNFSCPYVWEIMPEEDSHLTLYSRYEGDNAWDMSVLYLSSYQPEEDTYLEGLAEYLSQYNYDTESVTINGHPALDASTMLQSDDGENFYQRYVAVENGSVGVDFTFVVHESYQEEAEIIFQAIIDSISFH